MADPVAAALLDHVVARLLDRLATPGDAGAGWHFGPVVLVSSAADAASAAVAAAAEARGVSVTGSAVVRGGADLDREIAAALAGDQVARLAATLAACRLVVVDRIDRVAAGERRQALVHLLDESTAAGAVWVVSTAVHPATDAGDQCGSRLCGGLVVPLAEAAAAPWQPPAGAAPSLARIIRAAARLHDLQPAAVVGPSRQRTVAAARSLAMYLGRRLTDRSLQAIGAACGGRDHSTVLHAVRVCARHIAQNPVFAAEVARIAAALGGHGATGSPAEADVDTPRRTAVGSGALDRAGRGGRQGRRRMA